MSSPVNNDSNNLSKSFNSKNYNFSYDICCEDSNHESIENSIKSILESEASISECASKIFCYIIPREFDKISDIQQKVDIFTSLLIAYSKRTSSLSKLLHSNSNPDAEYIPNPHIDIFDTDFKKNSNLTHMSQNNNINFTSTSTEKTSKSYDDLINFASFDESENHSFLDNKANNTYNYDSYNCK